ncbi:MAG: acyl-CoA dehydrogenase [Rhizobiales bacterium TMED83]|nr:acyl-CoA dehydrogenase [Rhodobiaceae bacterium]RPF92006.1 MAG: acyl-CoA dehydrogenase [Rhizobiales bacterium TMED83]
MSVALDMSADETPDIQALVDRTRAVAKALEACQSGLESPLPEHLVESQFARHGRAWAATYVAVLTQLADYCADLAAQSRLGALEYHLVHIVYGEYLNQLAGGLPMSQGEIVRPTDMGLTDPLPGFESADIAYFRAHGNTSARRGEAAELPAQLVTPEADSGLDETHLMIRDQFRRFAEDKVMPHAHGWHLDDALIPLELIDEMAGLGVFGLTIPESFGGLGMGKQAMCVVSEELSRGYIGVGSLGTRTDIAAELIMQNGTQAQKEKYLPSIASGQILPTAVFTEPNTGSDLASLTTRAKKTDDGYRVFGAKTWITHAARADLMTLLVRSEADIKGHAGLSMFLAEKPRGTDNDDFPVDGLSGGEISVLGYRGMKEYDLGFDDFHVDDDALLGGQPGAGFKQLMQTFESARIQTAARAVGVAQSALDLAFKYALDRQQFGKAIFSFERISGKIVMMAAEILAARQLTYFAARRKEMDARCDVEAGMAKLLAARVAWAAADNGLQIHGGNGFALEYPISRVLCDARILNIFEGAAEIQADIIARRIVATK